MCLIVILEHAREQRDLFSNVALTVHRILGIALYEKLCVEKSAVRTRDQSLKQAASITFICYRLFIHSSDGLFVVIVIF